MAFHRVDGGYIKFNLQHCFYTVSVLAVFFGKLNKKSQKLTTGSTLWFDHSTFQNFQINVYYNNNLVEKHFLAKIMLAKWSKFRPIVAYIRVSNNLVAC